LRLTGALCYPGTAHEITCTDGCDQEQKAVTQAARNTTRLTEWNLPIGGLAAHHHCLCAFHKITQTLRKLMAYNRCTQLQRAVAYTILAKVHATLRGSETEEELNERLQRLHSDVLGNFIEADPRYLDTRPLASSRSKKGNSRQKKKAAGAAGGPSKKQRGTETQPFPVPSRQRGQGGAAQCDSACSGGVDRPEHVSEWGGASAATAKNDEGGVYHIKKFCSYDADRYELLVVWEGTDGEPSGESAFNLYHDLGDAPFGRLCEDAGIDVSAVKESCGIGADAGVEVRRAGPVDGAPLLFICSFPGFRPALPPRGLRSQFILTLYFFHPPPPPPHRSTSV
jgi:hypothetical protein